MESARRAFGRAPTTGHATAIAHDPAIEAVEFVRFCYRRRRIGWPELYDEMCAVAGRRLYEGWGKEELAAVGIGFALFEMSALAGLAARVIAEENTASDRERLATRSETSGKAPGREPSTAGPDEPAANAGASLRMIPGAI